MGNQAIFFNEDEKASREEENERYKPFGLKKKKRKIGAYGEWGPVSDLP